MRQISTFAWRLAALSQFGRRLGLDLAYRRECFRRYVEVRRLAQGSEDPRDHATVARAYRTYLRAHLTEAERQQLAREDASAPSPQPEGRP